VQAAGQRDAPASAARSGNPAERNRLPDPAGSAGRANLDLESVDAPYRPKGADIPL